MKMPFTKLTSILLLPLIITNALPAKDLQFSSFRVGLTTKAETAATSLSTDDHGNTYIVGNTYGSFGKADVNHLSDMSIFIAKFSRTGILVWLRRTGSAKQDHALNAYYFGAVLYVSGSTRGNISQNTSPQSTSQGIQDGFVLAYDSFTGKRKWSRQIGKENSFAEVNVVTASQIGGVLVSGHSNASLFEEGSKSKKLTGWRFFVARLNHDTGETVFSSQHNPGITLGSPQLKYRPVQITSARDNRFVFLIVETVDDSRVHDSIFISLLPNSFSAVKVQKLSLNRLNKVSKGLIEDVETGDIVISYSVQDFNAKARDFGLQLAHRNNTMSMGSTKMVDMNSGSDDICKGITLLRSGYALLLGSVISTHKNKPIVHLGVWIYDLRTSTTVETFLNPLTDPMSSVTVAGVDKDSDENLVFAGVHRDQNGARQIMLGTFGIPKRLKLRPVDGKIPILSAVDPSKPGNGLGNINNTHAVNGTAESTSFTLGSPKRTEQILIICFCVGLGVLMLAVVFWCAVRMWRTNTEMK